MDFTPTEFFVRATGDWNMIKEYPELASQFPEVLTALKEADVGPRPWMSLTANIDEGYPFMQGMGWMQEGAARPQVVAPPSQNSSRLNTLLGTGKLQRDTRTSGNFGSPQSGTVSLSVLGNLHWLMLIHLERGAFGCDVQQAKARALYVAGEATKRHVDLPTDFVMPEGVPSRWTWLPLTARLAGAFNWEKFYQKPEAAAGELAPCDDAENDGAAKDGHVYSGPPGGYKVDLRDGVTVRIRFSTDQSGTMHTEYRMSSRRMPELPHQPRSVP